MMPVLALVAAYLIGAIPFGFLLVKWTTGAATLPHDIAKGYLAVWLAGRRTEWDIKGGAR